MTSSLEADYFRRVKLVSSDLIVAFSSLVLASAISVSGIRVDLLTGISVVNLGVITVAMLFGIVNSHKASGLKIKLENEFANNKKALKLQSSSFFPEEPRHSRANH